MKPEGNPISSEQEYVSQNYQLLILLNMLLDLKMYFRFIQLKNLAKKLKLVGKV